MWYYILRGVTMKKNNIIKIIIAFILILLIITILFKNDNNKGELIELTYNNVIEKIDNEEDFILVISQSTCSHCATYKPKLINIAKNYNINIYYINIDLENNDIKTKFLKDFNLSGATPTTIFIKKGTETSLLNRIEGDVSEKKIIEKFKKMGFIE